MTVHGAQELCLPLFQLCDLMMLGLRFEVDEERMKTTWPNFTKFVCMLPLAVAQSSFGSDAISYVFPVLWMTSCCQLP